MSRGIKKGSTLIEVLISIAILGIMLLPVLSIVTDSVKMNKESEDKEKAIAISQKYVEQIKSEDIFNSTDLGHKDKEEDGFQISQDITEVDKYKFNSGTGTKNPYSSIPHDGEVIVYPSEDASSMYMDILKKDSSIQKNLILNSNINSVNTLEIVNDKGTITVKLNNSPYVIEKTDSSKTSGELIIRSNSKAKVNINVSASNNTDDYLTLYFANEEGQNVTYTFDNYLGKVKTYSNIEILSSSTGNNSRLYEIEIQVKKDGKVLQSLKAYKSMVQ